MGKLSKGQLCLLALALATLLVLQPAPAVLAQDDVHIVQPGETLSQIAERYGTSVESLRNVNNLSEINFVWSGQRLVLPAGTRSTAENPAQSRIEETDRETFTYTTQDGDTLPSIAAAYRTSLAHLVELNDIYPGQSLVPGKELTVPRLIHVVQSGENLGTIADLYETTSRALTEANSLADPSLIQPGQRIAIVPPDLAERMAHSAVDREDGYHVHTEFPSTTEKWIDVDLSEQRVVAYEGSEQIRSFIVSTGRPNTPTVTGSFRIWAKTPAQTMYGGNRAAGTDYYLPNVQWVQYFYQDYSFHGTYWHNNFGQTMSHGCVNMTNEDAKWLYEWASPTHEEDGWLISEKDEGTLVVVHQ